MQVANLSLYYQNNIKNFACTEHEESAATTIANKLSEIKEKNSFFRVQYEKATEALAEPSLHFVIKQDCLELSNSSNKKFTLDLTSPTLEGVKKEVYSLLNNIHQIYQTCIAKQAQPTSTPTIVERAPSSCPKRYPKCRSGSPSPRARQNDHRKRGSSPTNQQHSYPQWFHAQHTRHSPLGANPFASGSVTEDHEIPSTTSSKSTRTRTRTDNPYLARKKRALIPTHDLLRNSREVASTNVHQKTALSSDPQAPDLSMFLENLKKQIQWMKNPILTDEGRQILLAEESIKENESKNLLFNLWLLHQNDHAQLQEIEPFSLGKIYLRQDDAEKIGQALLLIILDDLSRIYESAPELAYPIYLDLPEQDRHAIEGMLWKRNGCDKGAPSNWGENAMKNIEFNSKEKSQAILAYRDTLIAKQGRHNFA